MMRWPVTLLVLMLVGCIPSSPGPPAAAGTIRVEVVAGPICPVEREPPDPTCEPRPVEGARIFVQPGDGRDILVAEATTDAAGMATIEIAPGDYLLVGSDVEGLIGRPEPTMVTVPAAQTVIATLTYDTGIR